MYEFKEVSAAIIHRNDEILICRRAADDECALLWEFPGGKSEDGESAEECIIREIREELGIEIGLIDVFARSIYHFSDKEIRFTVFNAYIVSGELVLNVHYDARWIRPSQLSEFEFMPPDMVFVEKLLDPEIQLQI